MTEQKRSYQNPDFIYVFNEKVVYKLFIPIFYKLPLTPDQLNFLAFFSGLSAAFLFSFGNRWINLLALSFCLIGAVFDWADGAVARKRGLVDEAGGWQDATFDFIYQNTLIAGIVFGVFIKNNSNHLWLAIGLLTIVSLVIANFHTNVYLENFGFGFHRPASDFLQAVRKNKKSRTIDRLTAEILALDRFIFVFFFTIRYPIVLGALLNLMEVPLILILASSVVKTLLLYYIFHLFLDTYKDKKAWPIIKALDARRRAWIKEKALKLDG